MRVDPALPLDTVNGYVSCSYPLPNQTRIEVVFYDSDLINPFQPNITFKTLLSIPLENAVKARIDLL